MKPKLIVWETYTSRSNGAYFVQIQSEDNMFWATSITSMRAAYKAAWHQYRLFRYEQRLEE